MQFHEMNLTNLVALLLEKEVDFDVLHGVRPQGGTRMCVVVNLNNARSYRVNLGDRKHGNLVSGIHAENDHAAKISLDDLLTLINLHEVKKEWRMKTAELRTQEFLSGNPARFAQ